MNRSGRAPRLIAGLLILVGGIWVLQGVGILGRSRMTGDPFWAQVGAVLLVLGIGLGVWSARARS
jgi:hypothetical protein